MFPPGTRDWFAKDIDKPHHIASASTNPIHKHTRSILRNDEANQWVRIWTSNKRWISLNIQISCYMIAKANIPFGDSGACVCHSHNKNHKSCFRSRWCEKTSVKIPLLISSTSVQIIPTAFVGRVATGKKRLMLLAWKLTRMRNSKKRKSWKCVLA